tara:strand:- start:3855 stop:6923 length:3069 start_codon:yes stop_codon:yes gene_type:complete
MQMGGEPQMALGDYLGGQTDELAAEAARLGISKEQLLELLNQQAMQQPQAQPVGMAMGGDPAMAQGVGGMMPPDMPPPPAMPEGQGMAEQVMDPQVLEGLLGQAQQNMDNLDDAEDYATVINSIRGEDAPIEARYEELAGIVGEEDAAQTPESVLTLVQPAIMMGGVDEGIGGLAQAEMTEPVEGAMAQGIMSTVAPPPPAAPPMDPAMMGGPPPVNFNQGGLVRRGDNQPVEMMENGGEPGKFLPYLLGDRRFTAGSNTPTLDSMMLQNIAESQNQSAARQALSPAAAAKLPTPELSYDERVLAAAKGAEARYAAAGLGTAAERAAELEEQKNLTQAQMLFDIAGTALAFAGPMQGETGRMSAAERLAMAAQQTKLLPTIGARAQQQLEAKKAAGKEERALKLAAVQRGEAQVDAEIGREEARKLQELKNKTTAVKATKPFVTTKPVVIDKKTYPAGRLLNLRPAQVAQIEEADALTPYKAETGEAGAKKSYTVIEPIKVDGVLLKKGDVINVSSVEANDIKGFKTSVRPYNAPLRQGDVNVLLKDGTQKVLTPGTKAYETAIGDGALLTGMAKVPETDTVNLRMPNGDIKAFEKNSPEFKKAIKNNAVLSGVVAEKDRRLVNMINPESGDRQSVVEFSEDYYSLAKQDYAIGSTVDDPKAATTKPVTAATDITFRGETIKAGTPFYPTDDEIDNIKETYGGGAIVPYEKPDSPPDMFGKGDAGKALRYFSIGTNDAGTKMTDLYAAGADDPVMESQISIYTAPSIDKSGLLQKRQLPDFMKAAIKKRVLNGGNSPVPLNTLGLTVPELQMIAPDQDVPLLNPDNTVNIDRATADPTFIITGLDYTKSQGFVSSVNRFFNGVAGQLAEIGLGTGYAGAQAKITNAADKQLDALARKTINVARAGVDGRVFALDLQLLEQEVKGFQPGGVKSDVSALQQLRTVRTALASDYARAKSIVDANAENPAAFTDRVSDARLAMRDTEKLIAEYTAAILAYEANLTPGGAAANVSGGSATAGSRRVN